MPTHDPFRRAIAEAVERHGVRETARRLELGTESVLRLVAGEPVRRSTLTVARLHLAALRDDVPAVERRA